MEGYQLRAEVVSDGSTYFIQSDWAPAQGAVVTSLFCEGRLLATRTEAVDPDLPPQELRTRVRELHEGARARIQSLVALRHRLRESADGRAHLRLAQAFYRQRLYREAMAESVRAIKLGAEEAVGYSILGNCLMATGDDEKAVRALRRGIEISPDFPDLHNDLGVVYTRLERCRDAVSALERALELNPYYHEAFLNLAIALTLNVVRKQDYELSRGLRERLDEVLGMVLQLDPSIEGESYRQALAAARAERYDEALGRLTELRDERRRRPDDDLALEIHLLLRYPPGELDEATVDACIARVRHAIDSAPGYADLLDTLGVLYTAKCKLLIDRAERAFREALEINPKFARARKNHRLVSNDRQGIHFLLKALLD